MKLTVLIADDEQAARFGMGKALASLDCTILEAADGEAALKAIRTKAPDLVFLDLNMPGLDGHAVLRALASKEKTCEIIVVTANDSVAQAVECMRLGATDYITKPYEVEQIRAAARRNQKRIELERRVESLQVQLEQKSALGALVGVSKPMRELFSRIERAAIAPMDVLIRGETGTGKELIAREVHRLSDRGKGPFIAVNTAAISESLAESELFGHVKGAFTGADSERKGVFEQAHGGTLFLDEIGDMPAALQAKMLRVLQERSIQRVGSSKEIPVEVRVISATHQDLTAAVAEGQFRQDLFYRVCGIELFVPPLRQRPEDIILLANVFLDRLEAKAKRSVARPGPDAVNALLRHHWPGNVRELEHVITAAASMATGEALAPEELRLTDAATASDAGFNMASLDGLPMTEAKTRLVEWFERRAIENALEQSQGNVSAAARSLGIHRQNLQQKMTQLGLRSDTP